MGSRLLSSWSLSLQSLPIYLWFRLRPADGWLPLFLLIAIAATATTSILRAAWTPDIDVAVPAAVVGVTLGAWLARRGTGARLAWLLIVGYVWVVTIAYLASLLPWQLANRANGISLAAHSRQNLALLLDRSLGWLRTISRGGSSQETIIFALGLALLLGLLLAGLAWSVYRSRRPLTALVVVGLALAFNAHYGGGVEQSWLISLYVALAVLLLATVHYASLEARWARRGTDYSGQVRMELLAAAGASALVMLMLTLFLPGIRLGGVARAFQRLEPVQQAEATLERVFAGVRAPFREISGRSASRGVMPRSFLLGNAPELSTTVVMTATVDGPAGLHWRALHYDVYTGRGWARSDEREESLPAGGMIQTREQVGEAHTRQTVNWLLDDRRARYVMGTPAQFSDEVSLLWRGLDELVMVLGESQQYEVASRLSVATGEELRQSNLAEAPPAVMARYTELPEIPEAVAALAQEIVAGAPTPYDQARAIEGFLRQYPYSLEVPPPPRSRDPVEYFLFELQEGYCDYYSSAMTVMARSVGLPARLAAGYLAHAPDEQGVYSARHIDAHSWSEIYFAEYGWVAFEPTAPFPVRQESSIVLSQEEAAPEPPNEPVPLPEQQQTAVGLSGWWAAPLIGLLIAVWYLFHRRQGSSLTPEEAPWAYGRLRRAAAGLGEHPDDSQTPSEFEGALLVRMATLSRQSRFQRLLIGLDGRVRHIVDTFSEWQYGRAKPDRRAHIEARKAWMQLRRPLWLTSWLLRLSRFAGRRSRPGSGPRRER